ncbi:MAG: DUF3367 domain-containing protein, partial [Candidatus Omnitrophica bacterium]|nr:DUF3367 domain-containing protein [Candidatus Omnitrophota bacterium]
MVVALAGWFILGLVYVVQERLWENRRRTVEILVFSAGCLGVMSACNAFWIVPQAYVNQTKVAMPAFSAEAIATTRSWLAGISSSTSFSNVVRMQGDWTWYQGWYEPYRVYARAYLSHPLLIFLGWAIPAMVLLGAWRGTLRYRAAWILMAVAGVVLGMGTHPPFGVVYSWMVDRIPYFWVFRSPWFKFTLLTCVGYAVLFGQGVVELRRRAARLLSGAPLRRRAPWAAAGVVAVCVANMGYAFPVTFGQMHPRPAERTKLKPAHAAFPPYVSAAARWLRSQEGFFRILMLPAHVNGVSVYFWGLGSTTPALYPFTPRPVLFQAIPSTLDFGNRLAGLFCQALYGPLTYNATAIPQRLGARFLIHEKDFEYDYFESGPGYPMQGDTPEFVAERIRRQRNLERETSFGEWDIYRIPNPMPRLDIARRVAVVHGPLEAWIPISETALPGPGRSLVFLDGIEDAMEESTLQKLEALQMVDAVVCHGALNDAGKKKVERQLGGSPKSLFLFQTTEFFDHRVRNDPAVRIPMTQAVWVDADSPVRPDSQGVAWRWMKAEKGDATVHLLLKNGAAHPQSVNLQWTVYSTRRMRDLFVYIKGDLKKTFKLEADQPQTIVLHNIVLEPGETPLRFYSPYEWDITDGERVCFAFQEDSFLMGKLTDAGQVWVPREGRYALTVTPQPIPEKLADPPAMTLQGRRMDLKISPDGHAYTAGTVALASGDVSVEVDQTGAGMHYRIGLTQQQAPLDATAGGIDARFETVNPVLHRVDLKTSGPCLIVFRESYFPFWNARVSGGDLLKDRVIADGIGNGFLMEHPGSARVEIFYTVQDKFRLGLKIALISTGLALLGCMACGWRAARKS